jgi:hypothetical protein
VSRVQETPRFDAFTSNRIKRIILWAGATSMNMPGCITSPFELTLCNENVLFAKSIPSVDTSFMGLSISEGSISQLNPDTSASLRDGEVPGIY